MSVNLAPTAVAVETTTLTVTGAPTATEQLEWEEEFRNVTS
jgi:hypothetical protein